MEGGGGKKLGVQGCTILFSMKITEKVEKHMNWALVIKFYCGIHSLVYSFCMLI